MNDDMKLHRGIISLVNDHSLHISPNFYKKWAYRPRTRSETVKGWQQAPLNINNLLHFINEPQAHFDDKIRASELLHELLLVKVPNVAKCLQWKASAEKINGSLHCEVIDRVESSDPLLKALGGKEESRPLDYLKDYCKGYTPFSQQLIGAHFLIKQKRAAILYDMRVGKTLTALIAANYLLANGLVKHVIVVAPRILLESPWADDIEKQGKTCVVLNNGKAIDEATISHADSDFYAMSYETLVGRYSMLCEHLPLDECMIIGDETSRIKNPAAKRTNAFHLLTYHAKYVAMLTGTPMEQGPQDIWAQYFCIDRGASLNPSYSLFENEWLYRGRDNKYRVSPRMRDKMMYALQTKGLRYIRSEADQFAGKDKNYRWIQLPPTNEQAHATDLAIAGMVNTLDGGVHDITSVLLALYGFLREICCGYNKVRLADEGPYSKFRFLYDAKTLWLETYLMSNPGVPLVIFTEFTEHEQIISEMLDRTIGRDKYVWFKRDANTSRDAADCVRRFQEGDVRVIMMKTTSAEGITLNRIPAVKKGIGSYPSIIYMAPTWALGRFMQSRDRCVGVHEDPYTGETKNICTPIYCLITKGSIEEKIMNALKRKQNVSQSLLKDVERKGHTSFVDELRLEVGDMAGDFSFDPEEFHSRRVLRISPERKCSHRIIRRQCKGLLIDGNNMLERTDRSNMSENEKKVAAAQYLMSKYDESGNVVEAKRREKVHYGVEDFDMEES